MSDLAERTARKRAETLSRGGSVFKVNPANALGIESEQAKSKLIALALTNPANYHKLRDAAIASITKKLRYLRYILVSPVRWYRT